MPKILVAKRQNIMPFGVIQKEDVSYAVYLRPGEKVIVCDDQTDAPKGCVKVRHGKQKQVETYFNKRYFDSF